MKKLVVSFVSAAALAVIGVAAAGGNTAAVEQQSSDNGSNAAGIFISGDLGYSNQDYKKSDFSPQPTTLKTGGFAWAVNGGYQFNQYFAVEGSYMQFADAKATVSGATSTLSTNAFGLNAKGILPLNEQFDLFGKLGAMYMDETAKGTSAGRPVKTTEKKWTPDLGVGAAYKVNDNVALTLQDLYTFKRGNIKSTNSILAGVGYKFTV